MDEPNTLEFEDGEEELSADTDEESASVSNSESEDDDESSSDELTLGDLLQSRDIPNDENDDDEEEESGDDDWDPSKDNPKRKKQTKKEKKKKKLKMADSEQHNDTISSKEGMKQNYDKIDVDSEDDDNDFEPGEKTLSETKKEAKKDKKKRKKLEKEQAKLKKKAKKSHLKLPDNDSGVDNTESANSLEHNIESENVTPTSVNSLNSATKSDSKPKQQVNVQQTSAGKKNNQSETTEVSDISSKGKVQTTSVRCRKGKYFELDPRLLFP